MIKKVAILNGRIEHIYHEENEEVFIEGAKIEEREMEYSDENGWREVGFIAPLNQIDRIRQLEKEKKELTQTLDMILTEIIPNIVGGF